MSLAQFSTSNEKQLHAALKEWYARPGDHLEAAVDGFFIDIVRPGGDRRRELLVEIQTRGFGQLKRKLNTLLTKHRVRLVYPIAQAKWLVKIDAAGKQVGRRKSPKRGSLLQVFEELVGIPELPLQPGFSLEALLIEEEEVRRFVGVRRAWRRRGWATEERRLLKVAERRVFRQPADFAAFLPDGLDEPFSTADLAEALDAPRGLMQKMAYCLRAMGELIPDGKRGNAILYRRKKTGRRKASRRKK
jgi:hypothetical protein